MKRTFRIIALLALGFVVWYFGIKPSDYNISFKAKTSIGHAYSELLNWGGVTALSEATTVQNRIPYHSLTHELQSGDKVYKIQWTITRLNDSIISVKAGINEPGNSLMNRLRIPFQDTEYEAATLDLVQDYKSFLDESTKQFRIAIDEKASQPEYFCACTRSTTSPEKKAFSMMRDYSYISGFITSSGLTPQGRPLVDVINFDEENRMLEFDFCFPVDRIAELPESPDIFFKEIKGKPAIKATYNGDYRFSEKSWYKLFEYAEIQGFTYRKTPLEVYHNNPNMGGDALKWTTTIYLPLEK